MSRGLRRMPRLRLRQRTSVSPAPGSKRLAHSHSHIASPGPVVSLVGWTQVPVAGAKTVKQEVWCHPDLKSFAHMHSSSPGVLDAYGIERPRVERLRYIFSEQECGRSKHH